MHKIVSSPIIRSPSLLPRPLPRRRRTLTPPLPPALILALRILLVALVLWSEILAFRVAATWQCGFDDSPSVKGRVWDGTVDPSSSRSRGWTPDVRWRDAARSHDARGKPFHVLILTDPQLLDMRSYPSRNWVLRWLGVKMTDLYARKSWKAVTRSRGKGGGGVDAVVWLGDLLDSGTEMVDRKEHSSYVHRFHLLFPLPRASTSSFSALSSSPRSRSHLIPPIPSITLPGNHDLGLHLSSPSLARYARELFEEAFGPPWGEREWNGWSLVWIDSMALLEEEFWEADGGQFREMRRWLDELGRGTVTQPRILLTHTPLYRPEGTLCGRLREHSRPIYQGAGKNYQNELDEQKTRWLVERVRPSLVYSGDDHDSCIITHPYTSPLDGVTPVVETTVKAFSMAMGVRRPGYHLLSLYAPLPPSSASLDPSLDPSDLPVSYTYTQTNCTLPDQLGTYLHLYLPLAASFFLFFLVPKLGIVARTWMTRRRHRRVVTARSNGSEANGGSEGRTHRHKRSLSSKLSSVVLGAGAHASRRASLAEDEADADDVEAQYPALLGGLAHLDDGGLYSPLTGMGDGEEDMYGGGGRVDEGLPTAANGAGGGGRGGGHVRRVSRVWLWEGTGSKAPSPRHSLSGAPNGMLSTSASANAPLARLARLAQRLSDRLASNSLLAPLFRIFFRPVVRTLRLVWRKLAAPFVLLTGGSIGGPLGQAFGESVEQTWEVAWPAVALWLLQVAWYSM
ncbi:hypothetical protein NBRC10512_003911 [Rhodotorula toruloides]|uniref:RHTO0S02e00254g1_1 n=2 Tax=Rhodotorula toruloides TaxID=5286 RepID=A0A061ANL8_RHOTO|nr:CDC1p [Rhodotorula toruloides NP11]EMS18259.1 CDC1p [Rhodotorula toruloides NP11]CDR36318.1 RHTO0S02e00254g1_1 [Rhodotorula toruloides]